MPRPLLAAPDVEAALIGLLAQEGITARSVLSPPYPAVRLVRVGGTRDRIADQALVQIEAAHEAGGSKSVTLTLLEAAIAVLRSREGDTSAGAVVTAVDVMGAPVYVPDGVDGAPRYVATLAVTSRASTPQPA